jgi:hypothetical protein
VRAATALTGRFRLFRGRRRGFDATIRVNSGVDPRVARSDMTEQVKVFLSYRRADTQHVAGRAADRLGDRYELFMDMDTIP